MPDDDAPWLWLISGPNGSGKSTLASEFMPQIAETNVFLNADDEARSINQDDPASAAISAGRRVLLRIEELIEANESFAIETTLAGRSHLRRLERAAAAGYWIGLAYVWIGSPEMAIQRVEERVKRGGHWVPPQDVTRRFWRGLQNFAAYLDMADEATLYDNTGASPELVGYYDGSRWITEDPQRFGQIMEMMDQAK